MAAPITYDPNTPLVTTPYADWQTSFQQNFQQLYNAFKIDHIALDAAVNAGNHTYIQLPEQETQRQTGTGEISVYTKDVEGQTDQIFMRYAGNGTEFQFTNYQIYNMNPIGNPVVQTQFFTFLPGKILLYFGNIKANADNSIQLNPTVAKNIITINLTPDTTINDSKIPQAGPYTYEIPGIFHKIFVDFTTVSASQKFFYVVLANV